MLRALATLVYRTSFLRTGERIRRLEHNPIITEAMLPPGDGENINGPSLIRVPDWVKAPLGKYYLYFAHHHGTYIRLAYANHVSGPWRILPGGVLNVSKVPVVRDHIASPDVVIDNANRQLRMYFHGPSIAGNGQHTYVALSETGLEFTPRDTTLGPFYFRVFTHDGLWYAISKGGLIHRSVDGLVPFEAGHNCVARAKVTPSGRYNLRGSIRHVAVCGLDGRLAVYYTRIGDRPERIFRGWIDLARPWKTWVLRGVQEIARPQMVYEGAALPLKRSTSGMAKKPENALRDPAIFIDTDGLVYLLYSVMGEKGIAIAEMKG